MSAEQQIEQYLFTLSVVEATLARQAAHPVHIRRARELFEQKVAELRVQARYRDRVI